MSKGLEALKRIKEGSCKGKYNDYCEIIEATLNRLEKLEKERKELMQSNIEKSEILRIIKEKNVCISVIKDSNLVEEYNDIICYHKVHSMSFEKPMLLAYEEYDLLKECLR